MGIALISFYVTYMAYRNLKAIVPLLRPGELFDRQLADLDRSLFGGHDPAVLLHTLLGTGIPTHLLSAAYVAFIVFLPLSLALALVFSRNLQAGLFYATALSINWILGAASYFLLPSLWDRSTPIRPPSPTSPARRSPICRTSCSTSGSSSSATPRPALRRASRPLPRCTSR